MTDLTIIVTFYDEVAFLRSALTSIAVQTLASVDVLVINDNPDRFDAAALEALTEGFDVRVVHHAENQGLSAARNTGLKAARGRWVGFLDADDYYTLGGLRAQLDYAEETQADIVHAPCLLGTAGTAQARVLMRDAALHMQRRVVRGRMAAQEAQFIVSSWSSLYRTEFLRDNGLRFDPEQRKFEDRLFVLHTVTAAQKIAFTGRPARVWRQRADSISSAPTSPETHLLQVQLLEKCRTHMDAQTLPARFAKRELFNCVSRLIWDMDILPHLAAGTDPAYVAMGQRIQALLGEDSFGAAIFDDPMVAATSRVGMRTRKGRIRRTDFFALHKALREGDFAQAQEIMQARAPQPAQAAKGIAHPGKRLVLHVGMHKTGSTYVQHHLLAHRDALRARRVLVPEVGFPLAPRGRPGALSGHQGLVQALRSNDAGPWRALHAEIRRARVDTVVISAENALFPADKNRDALIADWMQRLGTWDEVQVVALARRPDTQIEAYWREWVGLGLPAGARGLEEFLVDHESGLTDYPALFAPFEAATGRDVVLGDFDALRVSGLWSGFCALARLPTDLPIQAVPRYATPSRGRAELMRLVNMTGPPLPRRAAMLAALDALPGPQDSASVLSPQRRAETVARFDTSSAAWASVRGYAPDVAAWRADLAAEDWAPMHAIAAEDLHRLLDIAAMDAASVDVPAAKLPGAKPRDHRELQITIRARPWLRRLLGR